MKKNILIAAFFILGITKNYAQKHELGNVTIEELKEKVCPKDSSVVAAFLFNKGKVSFELNRFQLTTEVEVKIKIYRKEGYKWAIEQIPFFSSAGQSVVFSNAVVYNLVNGKIEKTKAEKENEFIEQLNKYFKIKKISMPNVKEGSIIEYKYTINSPNLPSVLNWKFQKSIPVNYSEYTADIPEYFFYNIHRKGTMSPVKTNDKLNGYIRFDKDENSWEARRKLEANPYRHDNNDLSYLINRTTYKLENLPAIKEESFVNNVDNYISGLEFELSGIDMPNSQFKSLSNTWEDVAKYIYESENFGNQLEKSNYYEEDLKKLLQGLTTNEEKTTAIFNYVQSRMTWNKYNSYYCDLGVKQAFQDKIGDSADINLMLVSMLRYANLDANPVLVSTRSNGISIFPSQTTYNTVIAAVAVDNTNFVLLDATNKNAQPNILPIKDLNWFGRIIKKDGTSDMIDLMPKTLSYDVVNMIASIDDKGQVLGKIREQYLDYNALKFREDYSELTNDVISEKIEKKYNGIEVEDYELVNKNILNEPVVEKYSIKNSNAAEIIGNKIYFLPKLHFTMSENPFKQEVREYPIDFSYPYRNKYMVNITIPEGYQVESMPKEASITMDKSYGTFNYTIANVENKVQLMVTLDINTPIIIAEDYDILKQFYKLVIEKENEKIVLKKI